MIAELFALTLAASAAPCTPLPGAEAVLADPKVRYLIVGEWHGTADSPAVFLDLVCAAAARRPLVVALEYPPAEQKRLDAYMRSDGGPAARAAVTAGPAWEDRGGRASAAMLDLVEGLRRLKRSGADLSLLAFDRAPTAVFTSAAREEAMARALIEASGDQDRLVVTLTGAGHADREGFVSAKPPFRSAAQSLPASQVLSLAIARPGGEAWGCRRPSEGAQAVCQAWPAPAREAVRERGVVLDGTLRGGFDGVIWTGGSYRASPPARPAG